MAEKAGEAAKKRTIIVQVQKKQDGPWHEAADVETPEQGRIVGASIVRVKGAGAFRMLEVIE
jgi:hypothetical protein